MAELIPPNINDWRKTDVQAVWRRFGWTPPSEDPATQQRWADYRKDSENTTGLSE